MEATDFLITKPGGLTCYEALSKGLPLYIFQPIPGHEEKNCDFLINNHLAIKIDNIENINNIIGKLLFSSKESEYFYKVIEAWYLSYHHYRQDIVAFNGK
ncbi:hypothetical protein [Metabacillus sediminilitoris]|uniref:hypothetical protein n=1 Tax=Metabacillus sediminilitoris TaxID=2567941 RepID=UPI001D0DA32C|nr:hypothetical protein [Metabacillus sediminilitoris]